MDKEKDKTIRAAQDRATDRASIETLEKAERDCVTVSFFRMDQQKNQCGFGKSGVCCKICHMGPCRITPKAPRGVCGADADTIVARNFLREVAGGTAAHSDHGRHLVLLLKKIAEGKGGGYVIKDEPALRRIAREYGLETENVATQELALQLADVFLRDFTAQEEHLETLKLAPVKRQAVWERAGIAPEGIDRMVVESMHRTHMGVDHDPHNILLHSFRTALADGWGGSRIASQVSDIIFGSPSPVKSAANLGVLEKNKVNVLVHGHEPALSEMLAAAAGDPEVTARAKEAGAEGVNLAGICCTANEVLMRHGIAVAGNFLQQELAIVTGAVEMMIIDVQCCMPGLPEVAASYHTEIVSTSDIAKTVGAHHAAFNPDDAYASARDLLFRAIANFKRREPKKVFIPAAQSPLVAGFSVEAIKYMLGGRFRASFRPLNDAIIQGRIRGVAGIVGCNNPKQQLDHYINILTKELLKNNVLVLKTGCAAIASAKSGMLTPEAALEHAGAGLREVCEAIGMPPVLHMGSCVDNSRLLEAATEVVREGGLGDDLSDVPVVGVAPEWMSEKAVSIGCYFVASGVDVVLGNPFYISGSETVTNYLNGGSAEAFGASFHLHENPLEAAEAILAIIDRRREKLGINKKAERKLYDMKDRRELDV
ncbi:MAG TPA: anaerobic carbon-monoxide dehydrogenase catalytic subunit [Spirochaetota bacterium]|nr:anaerobic carbon-monoxide dehydrogenase catalytic subunit [Spirochaetota bacterium]HOS38561.1 anaerobic carbon-monoxide dehydrogenase catalytic subunit [Spirochaetota bacterium]HPI21763.1 anaerobic carbon-monoxide dehydrogenase catalytic subunit [Spirochaetota bacterium]HPU88076.1 anaerobic carbon-monoxide dehydrogenase catalytic subunit [Spirochaetota bacterium]